MILPVFPYPHPILRQKGKRIEVVTEEIRKLAADMLETMHDEHGLGLAAQQVGRALQLTVVDVTVVQHDRPSTLSIGGVPQSLAEWMPLALINPEVTLLPERVTASEGCLSFPEIHGNVPRAARVQVKSELLDGRTIEFEADGMLARCLQHEIDHLHGILFIDRMNSATRASLAGRLKRLQRELEG